MFDLGLEAAYDFGQELEAACDHVSVSSVGLQVLMRLCPGQCVGLAAGGLPQVLVI
jgi:hypothetical protein